MLPNPKKLEKLNERLPEERVMGDDALRAQQPDSPLMESSEETASLDATEAEQQPELSSEGEHTDAETEGERVLGRFISHPRQTLTLFPLKKSFPEIHIILDIDDTLANGYQQENIQKVLQRYPDLQPLLGAKLFINAVYPHFVHPGAIELVQWILRIPNVKLSFFSSAIEERNTAFVQELLLRALGNGFNDIKEAVSIYSRQHLVSIEIKETKNQFEIFEIYHGAKKKDLRKILKVGSLDHVILVDDDPTYIFPGQEKNVFVVPGTDDTAFRRFFHPESYDFPYSIDYSLLLMNHIFYIAGMLSKVFSMQSNCIADNLFSLQYEPVGNGAYKWNRDLFSEHQYYLDGLSELQKVNPNLEFYGGDLANEHFRRNNFTMRS
jgi:hypothetical protein